MLVTTTAALALAVALILVTLLMINRRDRRTLAATTEQLAGRGAGLREIAETVPAGIFQTDATGRRVYVNPRLADITGDASPAELLDRPWLIHEDDEQRVMEEWAAAGAAKTSMRTRFRFRRQNGEICHVVVEARPLFDDAENVTGWVGSVVDVTE